MHGGEAGEYTTSIPARHRQAFRRALVAWYEREHRKLPWRLTRDPYRIWVSEVMLQQTRVAAVIPYYERFLERFPDAAVLARAPEEDLLAVWSGLGYYSRARNLQEAARRIVELGYFPRDYTGIRRLPGIGDYTAAAIASIAFGLPHAALDGNVLRVFSRLTNDASDIRSPATRDRLRARVIDLLDRRRPGIFNQALMELGATLCLPRQPRCSLCPVSRFCDARKLGRENELPVKLGRGPRVRLERTLLVIERNGSVLMKQRARSESRLPGFWELPAAEDIPRARILGEGGTFRHSITTSDYHIRVLKADLARAPSVCQWIPRERLAKLPLATTAKKALAIAIRGYLPE